MLCPLTECFKYNLVHNFIDQQDGMPKTLRGREPIRVPMYFSIAPREFKTKKSILCNLLPAPAVGFISYNFVY